MPERGRPLFRLSPASPFAGSGPGRGVRCTARKGALRAALLLLAACTLAGCGPFALFAEAPARKLSTSLPPARPAEAAAVPPAPAIPADLAMAESRPPVPGLTSPSYLVMDRDTGKVLLAHNALQERPPASLTKVMTALLVLENGKLDDKVAIDSGINSLKDTGSTLIGLEVGEHMTVRDLLYGMMLNSGNDAAVALARYIAPTEAAFVTLMNRRAAELGMKHTTFVNPEGLDAPGLHTTAYDLAVLARKAMENPTFRAIVSTQRWIGHDDHDPYLLVNQNHLLGSYEGADGVKIGFTDAAGQTMIASAARGNRHLIAVVLGSEQRFPDAGALLDAGFTIPSP